MLPSSNTEFFILSQSISQLQYCTAIFESKLCIRYAYPGASGRASLQHCHIISQNFPKNLPSPRWPLETRSPPMPPPRKPSLRGRSGRGRTLVFRGFSCPAGGIPPYDYRQHPSKIRALGALSGCVRETRMQSFIEPEENATSALLRFLAARNRDCRANWHGVPLAGSAS